MNFKPNVDYRIYSRYFVNFKHLYQKREIVIYTGLILSFFTIAFFGLFALRPTIITIAALVKEIGEKKEIDRKLDAKLVALRQAQQNYSAVANDRFLVDDALPEETRLSQLVYQLEGLSQQAGVEISSLNFEKVTLLGQPSLRKSTKALGPKEVSFSLTATGDYANLSSLLRTLDEIRRLIKVDSFSFNKSEKEGTALLRLTITGQAYFFSEKETTAVSAGAED